MPIGDIPAAELNKAGTDNERFNNIYYAYLITGIFTLILYGIDLMEHLGWFALNEANMPEWLYTLSVLLIFSLAYILLQLIVGLPVIIGMIITYRKNLKIVIPAILLCVAVTSFALITFGEQDSTYGQEGSTFFITLTTILFALYGVVAVISGYLGIKEVYHNRKIMIATGKLTAAPIP